MIKKHLWRNAIPWSWWKCFRSRTRHIPLSTDEWLICVPYPYWCPTNRLTRQCGSDGLRCFFFRVQWEGEVERGSDPTWGMSTPLRLYWVAKGSLRNAGWRPPVLKKAYCRVPPRQAGSPPAFVKGGGRDCATVGPGEDGKFAEMQTAFKIAEKAEGSILPPSQRMNSPGPESSSPSRAFHEVCRRRNCPLARELHVWPFFFGFFSATQDMKYFGYWALTMFRTCDGGCFGHVVQMSFRNDSNLKCWRTDTKVVASPFADIPYQTRQE